jgi:stearoyl-CoA desaturase (delta-9 desaturase)
MSNDVFEVAQGQRFGENGGQSAGTETSSAEMRCYEKVSHPNRTTSAAAEAEALFSDLPMNTSMPIEMTVSDRPQPRVALDTVAVPVAAPQRGTLPLPPAVTGRIVWRYAVPIVTIHVLALAALVPWLFSWTGLVLCLAGTYIYGGLGINIAYHRLLTHRSFRCPLWLERFFVLVAVCCMEDAPGSWVATHRLHHNDSDEVPDPHSPLVNFLWSHMGWLLVENRELRCYSAYERYARDVLRDPFYFRLQRTLLQIWIYIAHAIVYFVAGWLWVWLSGGDVLAATQFGLSILVWGVLLRTVFVWHITWSVNSVTHLFGYRSYETGDNSRNNWIVALLANGEGWHNNHHVDPASASNMHRWWEFDSIWVVIRALEMVGLATDVVRPRHQRRQSTANHAARV